MPERAQEIGFAFLPLSAARGCRHLVVGTQGNRTGSTLVSLSFCSFLPTSISLLVGWEILGEEQRREEELQSNSRGRERCRGRGVFATNQLGLICRVLSQRFTDSRVRKLLKDYTNKKFIFFACETHQWA